MAPTGPKIPNFTSPCPAYKGILPLRLLQLAPSLASLTDGLMDHSEDKDMEGAGEAEVVLRLNSTTRLIFYQGGASAQGGVGLRQYGGGNNPSRRNPGRKQRGTSHGRSPCRKSPSTNHLPLLPLLHQVPLTSPHTRAIPISWWAATRSRTCGRRVGW